jgi:hypothetical protein
LYHWQRAKSSGIEPVAARVAISEPVRSYLTILSWWRSSLLLHTSSRQSSPSCLASLVYRPCLSNARRISCRPSDVFGRRISEPFADLLEDCHSAKRPAAHGVLPQFSFSLPPGCANGPNDRLAALVDVNMLHSDLLLTRLPSQAGKALQLFAKQPHETSRAQHIRICSLESLVLVRGPHEELDRSVVHPNHLSGQHGLEGTFRRQDAKRRSLPRSCYAKRAMPIARRPEYRVKVG